MTGKILYDFSNILDDRDSLDTSLLHQKAEKSISTGTAFYPFAMKPHIKQSNDKQQVLDQNWKNKYALKRPQTVADYPDNVSSMNESVAETNFGYYHGGNEPSSQFDVKLSIREGSNSD